MRDRDIRSQRDWQEGLDFMKSCVQERLVVERQNLLKVIGSQTWVPWHGLSAEQRLNTAVLDEVKKIVRSRGGNFV